MSHVKDYRRYLVSSEAKAVDLLYGYRREAERDEWTPELRTKAVAQKDLIRGDLLPRLRRLGALDDKLGRVAHRAHRYEYLKFAYGRPLYVVTDHDEPDEGNYPRGLPAAYRKYWDKPWTSFARTNSGFRRWLDDNGYLSPHFSKAEARCKCGTSIEAVNKAARDHAFSLEIWRHELGDVPIAIISWYRPRWYNAQIGGASQSQHIRGLATDHPREWVERIGRRKVLNAAYKVWANGGVGVYPWGAVHTDDRGYRARWNNF
jgi:hypothetical protein